MIIGAFLSFGVLSGIYFLSLLVAVPIWATAAIILGVIYLIMRGIAHLGSYTKSATLLSWPEVIIFGLCLALLTRNALNIAEKHGGWDAWALWNFHASYLTDSQHWRNLFLNLESDHPDYPLCLPATLGFFRRLVAGHFTILIPFIFSFLVTVSIPFLLFSEFLKKNKVVAFALLFLFAQDTEFVAFGVSEYADTLLGLFYLAAIICMNHAGEQAKYLTLSTACIGFCAWTKNEGAILALLFIVFHVNEFRNKERLLYGMAGFAFPAIVVFAFKLIAHVPNDMIHSLGSQTLDFIKDPSRYALIWQFFVNNLYSKFYYVEITFFLYLILCLLSKSWPGKQFSMVLATLAVYMLIYIVTTHGLEWHLQTSQDRLMHQLMPALFYVMALKFSDVGFTYKSA